MNDEFDVPELLKMRAKCNQRLRQNKLDELACSIGSRRVPPSHPLMQTVLDMTSQGTSQIDVLRAILGKQCAVACALSGLSSTHALIANALSRISEVLARIATRTIFKSDR
jgi:hypothetical protein